MTNHSDFTPDELAATGRALYGERWQTPLSQDLKVSDRTMRRWLAGDFRIPSAIVEELRAVLIERLKTIGGMVGYTVNPGTNTIFHSLTNAAFQYDATGHLSLLHPGFATPAEIPLITEGAKEALRREQERDPRVRFTWVDRAGSPSAPVLHGFLRGSVVIPPDVDLTEPTSDEWFDEDPVDLQR